MEVDPRNNNLMWQIILLNKIFGDRRYFQNALSKISSEDFPADSFNYRKAFESFLYLKTIREHRMRMRDSITYLLDNEIKLQFEPQMDAGISNLKWFQTANGQWVEMLYVRYEYYFIPLVKMVIDDFVEMNIL